MKMKFVYIIFSLLVFSSSCKFFDCVFENHFNKDNENWRNRRDMNLRSSSSSNIGFNSGMDRPGSGDSGFGSSSGIMFSMGSDSGSRNGQEMLSGNKEGMENGMRSIIFKVPLNSGIGTHHSRMGERMRIPSQQYFGYSSNMGSSMEMNQNFNNPISNGRVMNSGMELPIEKEKTYPFVSGMSNSHSGTNMGHSGIEFTSSSNAGWNPTSNNKNNDRNGMKHTSGSGCLKAVIKHLGLI